MSRPFPPSYKTANWPGYKEALKQAGSLTIWFDPDMVGVPPPAARGCAPWGTPWCPALGIGTTLFTRMWLTGQDEATVERFTTEVQRLRNVVECHLMAGDCDFLLRILAAEITACRRFQMEYLNALPGVQSIKPEIPVQWIKYPNEIPV